MKYFDEKNNQYQPLCYIHTVRQNLPDMNMSSDIDFVPFYNSHEFRAKDYYLNRQDFDYLKTKEVSKTKIQTGSNQFRKLFVYHSIDENSCSLIDEIVNIINQSKEKSVNVEKRKKLNIHSIIDLITTQDDGQEK